MACSLTLYLRASSALLLLLSSFLMPFASDSFSFDLAQRSPEAWRPLDLISFMLRTCVPTFKWSGLTQIGLSQECRITCPFPTGPLPCISSDIPVAIRFRLLSLDPSPTVKYPYPVENLLPVQSQQFFVFSTLSKNALLKLSLFPFLVCRRPLYTTSS